MKSTAKTVGLVMIIMVLSRLLSFASNLAYVTTFGTSGEMEVFSYSQQLPNILFTIFGTALTILIIPKFAGLIGTGDKKRAYRFADTVITFSVIFAVVLSILCIAAAPLILQFTKFRSGTENNDFAMLAVRLMLLVMVFYALNYIFQGILQSLGRFNMPAFVSVPSSLVVILYVLLLSGKFGVKGLVVATFIGLSLQALVLIPPIMKTEYRYHISLDYRNSDLRSALKLLPPVLIGTSAYQINMLVNVTLGANFQQSVLTILNQIQNVILYSILAFIFSITAVLFPKFTVLAAQNDMDGFKKTLLSVLKSVIYFLLPATFGFISVRHEFISFIYGWGNFTSENVMLASKVLAFYAIGILGLSIKEILDRVFYSLNDTRMPAINGVVIMVVNIAASFILIRFAGVLGIPLAYSIAALTGGFNLLYLIRRKIGPFGGRQLLASALKITVSAIIMLAAVLVSTLILSHFNFGFILLDRAIKLFIPSGLGALVYFISTYLLKVDEAVVVLNKVKARLGMR